jgi:hypothetical protein
MTHVVLNPSIDRNLGMSLDELAFKWAHLPEDDHHGIGYSILKAWSAVGLPNSEADDGNRTRVSTRHRRR